MYDISFERAQRQYDNYLPPEPVPLCECNICGDPIYTGEDHYNIHGDIMHVDCIHDWARLFKVEVAYEYL